MKSPLAELGLTDAQACDLDARLRVISPDLPAPERWRRIVRDLLSPSIPFAVHRYLYEQTYAGRSADEGPGPAWLPDDAAPGETNIGKLMARRGLTDYESLHAWSIRDREGFWEEMIGTLGIRLRKPYTDLMAGTAEHPQWLPGARLNIAESCFGADPKTPAIVSLRPGGAKQTMTYGQLNALTNRVANGLVAIGFGQGDAIGINMPMTPESVAIYLGIVKAGAVVVSISDSFAPTEIATRLRIANATGIFTQELNSRTGKGSPLYQKVIDAGAPRAIVVPVETERCRSLLRPGDVLWEQFLGDPADFDTVAVPPDADSNVLFSSGTTGEPKAIPWTHTTPIKCAADAWLHHDIRPGDVLAWPTNLGWMMGPWLVYAALVNHATIALYEGPPTGKPFGSFIQQAGVTMLGVVPSLVKSWRRTRCMEGLDWSRIRAFSSTGECSNADDMLYLMMLAGYRPVIEYCGGTEIGGGYITGTVVQPAAPATFTTSSLGLGFAILDEEGHETRNGEVFLLPPSIGLSTRLLNHDHHKVYFAGTPAPAGGSCDSRCKKLRRHGDQIERLGGGFFRHHGRTDDTMNLKGIKVSSAELERTLNTVEGIRETAAIAVPPPGGGPARLVVYAVPDAGGAPDGRALRAAMQSQLRREHGSTVKIHDVCVVDALPRTASNKVMRRVLREQYGRAIAKFELPLG